MTAFWTTYGSTILMGGLLLAAVVLIVIRLIRARRTGHSVTCGCGCKDCPGAAVCHSSERHTQNL